MTSMSFRDAGIKAVVFGWGGTLSTHATSVRVEELWRPAAAALEVHTSHSPEEIWACLAATEDDFWERTATHQRAGTLAEIVAEAHERLGADVPGDALDAAALAYVESIEQGVFTRFIFTDGNRSEDLIGLIGAGHLEGTVGTAPGSDPENASTMAWNAAYVAEYGALPALSFVREAYDAVIAIALAAEAAGSTDGAAIRDQLARIAGPPGEAFVAGPEGVQAALEAVREGDDINYEGAATPIDWNTAGDVTSGFMEIYGYRDGALVTIEVQPFTLE